MAKREKKEQLKFRVKEYANKKGIEGVNVAMPKEVAEQFAAINDDGLAGEMAAALRAADISPKAHAASKKDVEKTKAKGARLKAGAKKK